MVESLPVLVGESQPGDAASRETGESERSLRRLSPLRLVSWLSPFLLSRRLPLHLALLAVVLTLPGLGLGWQTDDHAHRATLTDEFPRLAPMRRAFPEMFAFIKDGMVAEGGAIDRGDLPWWSSSDLRLAFFRPVTGLTHWVDYQLWPHTPWLMHLQSIAWYALTVVLAALLFRRFAASPLSAGLAALIFTVCAGHGLPAMWLANRNAVLAAFFGICTILAHDRWRRDGWAAGAALAPMALLAGVLSNEGAVATGAYLVAYALFVDPDRTWRRFAALVPAVVVGAAWWWAYKAGGYGAVGSSFYVDPGGDPLRFVAAVVKRAPILLYGLFAFPVSDVHMVLSAPALRIFWAMGVCVVGIIALCAAPRFRSDWRFRFAVVGAALSVVPVCATIPSNRLLMFAELGGALVIAHLIEAEWRPVASMRAPRGLRWVAPVLVVFHLVFAPIGLLTASMGVRGFGAAFEQTGLSMPRDEAIRRQRLIVVSTPSGFVSTFAGLYVATQNLPLPAKSLVLASGEFQSQIERTDARTLVVSQSGGWLMRPGHWPADDPGQFSWVATHYLFQTFDLLFRDATPFVPGERIELSDIVIEILEVTPDGRPATVAFRFAKPLEDSGYRWVFWDDGKYRPFTPPAVGGSVALPAPRPPAAMRSW